MDRVDQRTRSLQSAEPEETEHAARLLDLIIGDPEERQTFTERLSGRETLTYVAYRHLFLERQAMN